MDLEDIGYYLYMQEQEDKKLKEEQLEYNVNIEYDFVGEKTTTKRGEEEKE